MEDALRDIGDTKDTGVETWMTGHRLHKGHRGDRGHWDTGDTGGAITDLLTNFIIRPSHRDRDANASKKQLIALFTGRAWRTWHQL